MDITDTPHPTVGVRLTLGRPEVEDVRERVLTVALMILADVAGSDDHDIESVWKVAYNYAVVRDRRSLGAWAFVKKDPVRIILQWQDPHSGDEIDALETYLRRMDDLPILNAICALGSFIEEAALNRPIEHSPGECPYATVLRKTGMIMLEFLSRNIK